MFPPGAGGLPTLKRGMRFRAPLDNTSAAAVHELRYRDMHFPGRAGWKEIVASTEQGIMLLSSTVPEHDRSQELADYPSDLLNSPPQDVEARIAFARQALVPEMASAGSPTAPPPGTMRRQRSSSLGRGRIAGEGMPH